MTNPVQEEAIQQTGAAAAHRIRVLLVDDQMIINEAVRRMLAPEKDIDLMYCDDPTRAIQVAAEFHPTVILQDLVMPQVDGITMLRFYRAAPPTREVPIVVLSTKEEPKVKAEAFSLGASDYLVKLPDPIELIARIRHHSRGYIAQIERNEAYAALKLSKERLADELFQAAKYVISLLPERLNGTVVADWSFIPSVALGGDAFGYHWLDPDHFAMYLLDVCGHGVKAALLSVSAMNVLRNQTLAVTNFCAPGEVLESLNKAFQMDRHNDMYFTMWYGVYDRRNRSVTYANGGHPPPVLIGGSSRETSEPQELSKTGTIIGAFPDVKFQEQTVKLPESSRLYIFSDGIYEIARPDSTMLSYADFVGILAHSKSCAGSAIEQTIAAIRKVRGGEDFEDDVSIVEIVF